MRMMGTSSNFSFLGGQSPDLARLGSLAERYFHDDAPAALIKLRQLAEFLAKKVAARHALLSSAQANFDDVLRALKFRSVMPREVADQFYHFGKIGNSAAHEDVGTPADGLTALKMARTAAIWFQRTYGNAPTSTPNNLFLNGKVLRLRLSEDQIRWVQGFLRSPLGRAQIEDAASDINMHNIEQGAQGAITLLIPCASERAVMLEKLEAAFARALLDRLESALLAKAFRGELVPQDPGDEPAQTLLDRIRAERAAAPKVKRGRKPGKA